MLASGKAEAISITFEKIADTNTPIPGGSGNFESLNFFGPSLDDGNVAFEGESGEFGKEGFQSGIYTSIGGELNVVADTNTPIPGKAVNFTYLIKPSLDNGNVAFEGESADFENGLYTSINGELNVVADTNTPIPGKAVNFTYLSRPSLDNGSVAFVGDSGENFEAYGIYTNIGGELNIVADTNTPIPGGTGDFEDFSLFYGTPSLDNGNVAFTDTDGIYTSINGELDVVADTNTPIPGGIGNFDSFFFPPSLDNGNVAFWGERQHFYQQGNYFEQGGIYTNIGGELNVVADTNTPIPGGIGNFGGSYFFQSPSLDNGNVAFLGGSGSSGPDGIYTNIGGTLAKVIGEDDLLDGKRVRQVSFGEEGLSGKQIAFAVDFNYYNGLGGIYVATVPEPSSILGTLAFGAFGASWVLKHKLKKQKS